MTDQANKDLPPLPEAINTTSSGKGSWGMRTYGLLFTAKQMRAYARAALSASAPASGSAPSTPEQVISFIGCNFGSMEADGWTEDLPQEPTGDLSNVRYSLSVHDLLSAFSEWSDNALLAQYGSPAWQPIETAPHGENVLLSWKDWDGEWQFEVGPASWGWRTPTVSNMSRHGRATHWMPLPPAPQEGK